MNLAQLIAIGGERYPDAEAIVDGPNRWKYGDWVGRIGRIAASLLGLGIGKGDHVVLSLKNREQHAAAYWACQLIGAIATPINWRYAAAEVGYVVPIQTRWRWCLRRAAA